MRQVQVHEPILVSPDSADLKAAVEHTFAELAKVGVPINLVTFYDDLGANYEWVVKLPVCHRPHCVTLGLCSLSRQACTPHLPVSKAAWSRQAPGAASCLSGSLRSLWQKCTAVF